MKLRYLSLLFIFTLATTSIGMVQEEPDFSVWYDVAAFKMADNKATYYEIYLSIAQNDLTPRQIEEGYEVAYIANLQLQYQKTGETVVDESWEQIKTVQDSTQLRLNMPILDQIDLVLFPGQYSATLTVKDKYAERQAIYVDTLDIPEFNDNELLLSNIQFSSLVESSEEESEIVKNGLLIVPHPSRLFGEGVGLPLLYFYVEIYNLGVEEGKKGTFQADYQIVDFSGKTIKSFPIQNVTAYGPSAILASAIKLENVPLGNKYFLSIKITDPLTGKSAARREPFHVFQGVDQLIAKDREEFYIPDLTEENEPGYYGQAFHHFNERDIQLYKSLSFIGKRQFLIDFWENLDPTPGTPVNEFFNENAQRFLFATKEYGYSNVPGWRSDRGRVFILYGQVSEIDREYFSKDFAPYEIWVYNDLGDHISISKETRTTYSLPEDDIYLLGKAAYFVFGELNNDGNYYLIHSNVDGELKSIDWRGDLKKYEEGHIFHSRRQGQDSDEIQIGTND